MSPRPSTSTDFCPLNGTYLDFFCGSRGFLGNLRRLFACVVSIWTPRKREASFPTGNGEVAERLKAHAWKACWGQPLQGSNPCLSQQSFIFQLQFVMKNLFALLAIAGLVMFAAPEAAMAQEEATTEMAADTTAETMSAEADSAVVDSAVVDSAPPQWKKSQLLPLKHLLKPAKC